ncbi:MAG TPA: DUF47 family protein [Acidimicrobiales bacterium]|nr:DUF47 family protein [Acidimicrobiales bacterium]
MDTVADDSDPFRRLVDDTITLLFAQVGESVGWATTALLHEDTDAANRVIAGDQVFDDRCNELIELVKERLSGSEFRAEEVGSLATILQIVPELERSADLAEHIAQRSLQGMGGMIPPLSRGLVQSISEVVMSMWKKAGDAYATRSRDAGLTLADADNELDELCASLAEEGVDEVESNRVAIDLALVARFYERLGDHAVNLARRTDALGAPRRLTPAAPLSLSEPLRAQADQTVRSRLQALIRRVRLAPGDGRFFALFEAAARNARECAIELRKLVVSPGELDEQFNQIKGFEREGDRITVELLRLLDASFLTPFDREDIHELVEELDDVVDEMFSAGSMIQLVQVETPLPDVLELAELLVTMADELVALIDCLRKKEGARYRLERIEQLEHHGDALYRRTIQRLFSGEYDAIEILKWKDIVQAFESSANAIEDVSDVVESILVKGA